MNALADWFHDFSADTVEWLSVACRDSRIAFVLGIGLVGLFFVPWYLTHVHTKLAP